MRITGTALALVEVEHIDIAAGHGSYRASGARENDAIVTAFPEAAVPVGSSPGRLAQLKRIGWDAWMHAAMPCLIEVGFAVRGTAGGSGTLAVALEAINGGDPAEHIVECVVGEKTR